MARFTKLHLYILNTVPTYNQSKREKTIREQSEGGNSHYIATNQEGTVMGFLYSVETPALRFPNHREIMNSINNAGIRRVREIEDMSRDYSYHV